VGYVHFSEIAYWIVIITGLAIPRRMPKKKSSLLIGTSRELQIAFPPLFIVKGVHGLPLRYDSRLFFPQKGHMLFGFKYEQKISASGEDKKISVFITACPGHGKKILG
jgi:hypothetical protein